MQYMLIISQHSFGSISYRLLWDIDSLLGREGMVLLLFP